MRMYKYQAEAFQKLMGILQNAKYCKPDGTELNLGIKLSFDSTLSTRNGRTYVKTVEGYLFEFTPELLDYQLESSNVVDQVSASSFKVYTSVSLMQSFHSYWREALKPAIRERTVVFHDIVATKDSVKVSQRDGKVFEWLLEK